MDKLEVINKLDAIIHTLHKTSILLKTHGEYSQTLKEVKAALEDAIKLSYAQEMGQPWYKYASDEQLLCEVKLRMIGDKR